MTRYTTLEHRHHGESDIKHSNLETKQNQMLGNMLINSKYFLCKVDVDTLYFAKSLFLRLFTINFHNYICHRYTYVVYVPSSSDVDATNANSENILKQISQTDTS